MAAHTDGEAAPPARERRRARARLDIAWAALRLFQKKGYEGTTVADIAHAADYRERSFYRYFANKEDVVFFEIDHLLADVGASIGRTGRKGALWDDIQSSVLASIDRFQAPGQEFAAEVMRTWMTDPALAGPFQRFCGRWHAVLAKAWSEAHGVSDPAADLDAQLVAQYVVATCHACFRLHVETGRPLRPLLEKGFERLHRGLREFSEPAVEPPRPSARRGFGRGLTSQGDIKASRGARGEKGRRGNDSTRRSKD